MSGYLSCNGGIVHAKTRKRHWHNLQNRNWLEGQDRYRDGKRKFKTFTGKTEAEVKRKIREFNKNDKPIDTTQILFKNYLTNWLMNIKKGSIKRCLRD